MEFLKLQRHVSAHIVVKLSFTTLSHFEPDVVVVLKRGEIIGLQHAAQCHELWFSEVPQSSQLRLLC